MDWVQAQAVGVHARGTGPRAVAAGAPRSTLTPATARRNRDPLDANAEAPFAAALLLAAAGRSQAGPRRSRAQRVVMGAASAVAASGDLPGSLFRKMTDEEILRNLRAMHGWRNVDMGAGGNCLFLSIAPQVSGDDVAALSSRSPVWEERLGTGVAVSWEVLSARDRARCLRQIAMFDESDFIAQLHDLRVRGDTVPQYIHWRALELYKDMVEEFLSTGILGDELPGDNPPWNMQARYDQVRRLARDTPPGEMYDFVLRHAEKYMDCTGREGNWAGSSEMAALASAFERPFAAFGNNWVSQDEVELRCVGADQWEVMPYFDVPAPGKSRGAAPVRIFQTRGGGHYQMLHAS